MHTSVKIVVARYNESLSWMREFPFNRFRYWVYNKGINEDFERGNVERVVSLPNVGRCDHTYLHHLVTQYDSLDPITVFFPGCLDAPVKKHEAKQTLLHILKNRTAVMYARFSPNVQASFGPFTLSAWTSSDAANRQLNPEQATQPAQLRPFGRWFTHMFGNTHVQWYCLHGILSVRKEDVRQHPVARYARLLATVDSHSNPEAGHFLERSWVAVFHPLRYTRIVPFSNQAGTPRPISLALLS